MRLNDTCRSMGKKFYAGGIYGLLGYIFCDLQDHEFISPYAFRICCFFDGLMAMVSGIVLERRMRKTSNLNLGSSRYERLWNGSGI